MHWDRLIGHRQQLEWLQNSIGQNRMATSFLYIGPEGIGKRTFALLLAQSLLCRNAPAGSLEACDQCEDCAQVRAGTHPDLIHLAKPEDKATFPLEMLIGDRPYRMRQGLCYDISLRPYNGRRKVAIIDGADTFNAECANALLKTLEEPPTDSVLILIGTSLQRQLPTIRSRCQNVLFRPLENEQLAQLIQRLELVDDPDAAKALAIASEGSITEARLLRDPQIQEFRGQLFDELCKRPMNFAELAKACGAQADSAGKEARFKRDRIKLILRQAGSLYQWLATSQLASSSTRLSATPDSGDALLTKYAERCLDSWSRGFHGAFACWQACLKAIEQVDRNANQTSLLLSWTAELAKHSGR